MNQMIVRATPRDRRTRFHVHRLRRVVGSLHFGYDGAGRDLPTERRHLDRLRSKLHVREPETTADDPAIAKELLDLMRMRGGADVEVFGTTLEQQIANAAAYQVRNVVMFVKPIQNFERVGIDVAARDCVLRSGNDGRLRHRLEIIAPWIRSS